METPRDNAKNREDNYGFLADIFREELTLEHIRNMLDAGVLDTMLAHGMHIDRDFFISKPIEQVEEELACEYTFLFIGPGKHVPPYESVYVPDSTGRVGYFWGECTVDMKNWVDHYGLELSARHGSIPDHISVELEFMQKLVEQERLAWEREDLATAGKCLVVEKTFFEKHLNRWVPEFCNRVIKTATLDFYREMTALTRDFMTTEKELFSFADFQAESQKLC